MVKIYTDSGMAKRHIGTCEDGKVYREETFGRTQIGSYENGNVYYGIGYMKKRVGGYDERRIYEHDFFDTPAGKVDSQGNAYNTKGFFDELNGRKISDVGAVAAAQLLFPGCYYEQDAAYNRVPESDNPSAEDGNSGGSLLLNLIVGFFGMIFKFIFSLPLWVPYVAPFVAVLFLATPSGGSSDLVTDAGLAVIILLYMILHTALLFICKKRNIRIKYWPVYVEFVLLIATFVHLWAVPSVAFQLAAVIYIGARRRQSKNEAVAEKDSSLFCPACGTKITDEIKFCPTCGNSLVNMLSARGVATPIKKKPRKSRAEILVIFPLVAAIAFGGFSMYRYSGYEDFVEEYFDAMESGDSEEVMKLYSWEYVQADNERIIEKGTAFGKMDPLMFTSETLEEYVENKDKYYRFLLGKNIESWEIKNIKRNYFSLSTVQMEIEVYVVYDNSNQDIIAFLEMERSNGDWYMTGCDAYYAD